MLNHKYKKEINVDYIDTDKRRSRAVALVKVEQSFRFVATGKESKAWALPLVGEKKKILQEKAQCI